MDRETAGLARQLRLLSKLVTMATEQQNNQTSQPAPTGNAIKDPKDWVTGDEPMTEAQRSYLHTLAGEAHETPPENMTKAEASEKIDELQHKTGRGLQEGE